MSRVFLVQFAPATAAVMVTLASSALLARLAPRVGWVDGGDRGHKRGVDPVPLIGGAAILVGLLGGWACLNALGRDSASFVPGRELAQMLARELGPGATLLPWGGVAVAFAVGLIDDLSSNGLRPLAKLAGQALAGLALGLPLFASSLSPSAALIAVLALVAGAVVATNALNTFDNADGAATGLGLVALALPAPLFAAPLLAFLPFNLGRRNATSRWPKAILGDAGSHVLGMLILLTPAAWPALALPVLDLARLCVVRHKLAQRPWIGDRRHLAHRLEQRGSSPIAVAAWLIAAALPSVVLGWLGARGWLPGGVVLGLGLTALAFGWLLRRAPCAEEVPSAAQRALASGPGGTAH